MIQSTAFPLSFISANSKNGFFSLYDKVFDTQNFDRIYLLAGGPGTGKSTFLRTVSKKAVEMGACVEEMACSSDPSSLDGVILSHGAVRIGVIDATPPHGRIITQPAICEEMIDLGTFWDARILCTHKESVSRLYEEKKRAYRRAYALLAAYGSLWEERRLSLLPSFDKEKAKRQIKHKLSAAKRKGDASYRILRAFSGSGEIIMSPNSKELQNLIYVSGNANAAEIYLSYFNEILSEMRMERTVFLSPIDGMQVDAIYLPEIKTLLMKEELRASGEKGRRIVADRFFNAHIEESKEHRLLLKAVKEMALSALRDAKTAHAIIEKYYVDAMDFKALGAFRDEKVMEILGWLFPTSHLT